jgi:cytoskeletal protein CcmA (bactofilin family)
VANHPSRQPEKISADCPHCGFSQLESPYAKSTFCRKCGQHYSIEKLLSKEVESVKGPSFFDKISKMVSGEKIRKVRCFSCNHQQEVSTSAQSSLCPSCGSYIDLRDLKISGPFGRSIQTQGEIHITSKGDVTSAKVACGTAIIEGKLRGTLQCTGVAHVKMSGKILGAIDAYELFIDKRSDVEFVRTVKVHTIQINGKVSARIKSETGVTINKGGYLEGTVYAKSISIEKGGVFSGELFIGQQELEQPDLLAPGREAADDLFPSGGLELGPA